MEALLGFDLDFWDYVTFAAISSSLPAASVQPYSFSVLPAASTIGSMRVEAVRLDVDEEATDSQPRESVNTPYFARIWSHIHF